MAAAVGLTMRLLVAIGLFPCLGAAMRLFLGLIAAVGLLWGEEGKKGSSFVKLQKITKVASFSIFSPTLSILSTPGQSSDNNFQSLD